MTDLANHRKQTLSGKTYGNDIHTHARTYAQSAEITDKRRLEGTGVAGSSRF